MNLLGEQKLTGFEKIQEPVLIRLEGSGPVSVQVVLLHIMHVKYSLCTQLFVESGVLLLTCVFQYL